MKSLMYMLFIVFKKRQAVITNEGRDGTVSLSPCSNSQVLVNGGLVHKPIMLHHNDRYGSRLNI